MEVHGWSSQGTGWRTASGWVWPVPVVQVVGDRVRAEAVPADRASWEAIEPQVAAWLEGFNAVPAPQPASGSQEWQSGAVTVVGSYAWDGDAWSQPAAGAISTAGLSISLNVTGRVWRPRGALHLLEESTQPMVVTPESWSGPGPAEVPVVVAWSPGASLVGATRTDGGTVSVTPRAGGLDLLVPLAAGEATSLRVRSRRPDPFCRVVLEMQHAVDWEVRNGSGTILWRAPTSEGAAHGEEVVSLWARGVAGRWHLLDEVELSDTEWVLDDAWVLLAASGPGGAPAAVLQVLPVSGWDPVPARLRWTTAGATQVILSGPNGAGPVADAGELAMVLRYEWTGSRGEPFNADFSLEATGPAGSARAEATVSVHPRNAVVHVQGPRGTVSIAEEKARE